MCELCIKLEGKWKDYVKTIVDAHRTPYEVMALQCTQHIVEAYTCYATRHSYLMEDIYIYIYEEES